MAVVRVEPVPVPPPPPVKVILELTGGEAFIVRRALFEMGRSATTFGKDQSDRAHVVWLALQEARVGYVDQ